MKKKTIIPIIIILISIIGCLSTKNHVTEYVPNYMEKKLSFFDPYSSPWPDSNFTSSIWIRKTENIKITHETFKKIGYERLISYNYFWEWSSEERPLKSRIDSLVKTYGNENVESKYYREFWNRRKIEKNDSMVFATLFEIDQILKGETFEYKEEYINDTLFNLIHINFSEDSLTDKQAKENFEYLKNIGFHQSAYNVLKERYAYYSIDWNTDSLEKTLIRDSTKICFVPWVQDNTK